MSKRIFVTGAAGFIGFHLCQAIAKRGDSVIGLDNFNSYYSPQLKRDRALILKNQGIELIEGDILNQDFLNQAILNHQTTHLVHLAAQAGVRYSLEAPQEYIKSNIDGFLNILEFCRHHTSVPLIYASSSSVYGLNQDIPFSTSSRTDHQASLYGVTKKANELMAQTYHHLFGVSSTGLRFFTVYGPWGRPDMAYFSFAKAILEGRPIQLYNHGEMQRDFTYIDDIVEGIISSINLSPSLALYNLGNNKPETLRQFVSVLERELGFTAKIELLPMQKGDVTATWADIEDSKRDLDYAPRTSLDVGLKRFVQWYKEYTK